MRRALIACSILSNLYLAGCGTAPVTAPGSLTDVRVSTTFDPEVAFTTGAYGFLHMQPEPEGDLQIDFAEVDNRVREALYHSLKRKGFRYSDTEDLKYLVSYRVLIEPEYEMEILNPFDEDWKAVARMKEHAKGALVVKIRQLPSAKPVWIGIFDATILMGQELTAEEKDANMAYVVGKLMSTFPPK
jgi:hypothetical protein